MRNNGLSRGRKLPDTSNVDVPEAAASVRHWIETAVERDRAAEQSRA